MQSTVTFEFEFLFKGNLESFLTLVTKVQQITSQK